MAVPPYLRLSREPHPFARPDRAPLAFHRTLPGYAPTPLREAPTAAARLGVRRVWVKDETLRLGLPAFKILGTTWTVRHRLLERFGLALETLLPGAGGKRLPEALRDVSLVAATEGNHGRAVAHVAAWLGMPARIFVPRTIAPFRLAAIRGEGANVEVVDGGYEEAVRRAAQEEGPRALWISDVALSPGEPGGASATEGYATLLFECEAQLRGEPVDGVAVQVGVGALAGAVVRHFRRDEAGPFLLGVEPIGAACVAGSVAAGTPRSLGRVSPSILAGLNCEAPSVAVWPELSRGVDAYVGIQDEVAREAMRLLAADGIHAGPAGAAGLAGWLAARTLPQVPEVLHPDATLLVIATEAMPAEAAAALAAGALTPPPGSPAAG